MMNTNQTTNIRIRLTSAELSDLETVRQFLGLRSVSAAAARLAVWNARMLAQSLRSDISEPGALDAMSSTVGDVVSDGVRLAFRKFILDEVGK